MVAILKRSLAPGSNRKLEAAITELRELESKRRAVAKFYDDAFAVWNSVEEKLTRASDDYKKAISQRDLAGVKQAAAVLPLLRLQVDQCRTEAGNVGNLRRGGVGFAQFIRECPEARETLLVVARGKLALVTEQAAAVLAAEKERLPEWDSESLSHSPKIRAANGAVDRLTTIVRRIESEGIESTWNLAQQLLDE
jgi:hypothetical protein